MEPKPFLANIGEIQQLGGTRLVTLGDGVERGVRVVEFRNALGIDFAVMVDRGMDISWARYQGKSLCWHSPTKFVSPALRELDDDLGWMRSFGGGLLVTAGLDHISGPEIDSLDTYNEPARSKGTKYGIHGRIAITPARLTGYGEKWTDNGLILFAEGEVIQSNTLGENLRLTRRVEVGIDKFAIDIFDQVENIGYQQTPHMMLYHMNFGWPLLGPNTKLISSSSDVRLEDGSPDDDHRHLKIMPPTAGFVREIFEHVMNPDSPQAQIGLINYDDVTHPWGIHINYDQRRLPHFIQWNLFAEGNYVLGLEPATNSLTGRDFARKSGELKILAPGESLHSKIALKILDGNEACTEAIEAINSSKS